MEDAEVDIEIDFIRGAKGDKGEKGDQGEKGEKGDTGEQGKAFTFDDLTPEQIEQLRNEMYEGMVTDEELDIRMEAINKEMKIARQKVILDKHIDFDEDWEIPVSYIVGSNDLEVRYEGCPCILGEHYREVGEPGTGSTKIQLVEDMTGDIGEVWEFVKRG